MAKVRLPEEYPDNSDIKVVTNEEENVNTDEPKAPQAMVKKKSLGKKMSESLFPKEDRKDIADTIIFDYIIPGAKEIIQNVVTNSVEMLLFGTTSGRSRVSRGEKYTNYAKSSSKYSRDDDRRGRRDRSDSVDLDDLLFYSYAKADRAYQSLLDYIDEYGSAKVSDLYDFAGVTPPRDWTVDAYGWDDLSARADISPVRTRDEDGRLVTMYCLNLPRPRRIRG